MAPPLTVGWVHNLETTPSHTNAGQLIAIAAAFTFIAFLAIAVRFWQRATVIKSVGWDDYIALAGTVLSAAYSGVAIYQTRWGLGLGAHDFPMVNAVPFSRTQYIGGPLYCTALLGFKLSLLASYMRLAGFNRLYRNVLYVVLAMVVANQILFAFLLSFACKPVAKQWNPLLPGTCIDQLASYFALGGSSLGFDLLIILLPFPIIQRLQLDIRKKLALGVLFALGFFVSIIQILRMRTIAKLVHYTDSYSIIVWSIVELNVGMFICCAPSFTPLLRRFGTKMSSGYRSHAGRTLKPGNGTNDVSGMHTSSTTGRLSKGHGFSSVAAVTNTEDDEVALWSQKNEAHVWSGDRDGHAMSNLPGKKSTRGFGGDGETFGTRDDVAAGRNDIKVMREITVNSSSNSY